MSKDITITDEIRRELHTADARLMVREAAEGEGSGRTIEGYAIRFDTPSVPLYQDRCEEIREVIDRSAITQALLDRSDIKFTLFHNSQLLLARSKQGSGTLHYELREDGVAFSFEAPRTVDGDKALELVRAGVIDGCSFAFTTNYRDTKCVERESAQEGDKIKTICRVKKITGIYDMTLTPDPAYPTTEVANRAVAEIIKAARDEDSSQESLRQVAEMREMAKREIRL